MNIDEANREDEKDALPPNRPHSEFTNNLDGKIRRAFDMYQGAYH
jgi:hypothetical protein